MKAQKKIWLDESGLPIRAGVYLIKDPIFGSKEEKDEVEIDVYWHPVKGLCCFKDDFGSSGTGVNDKCDDHVSVQCGGIDFIRRLRNFTYYGVKQDDGKPKLTKEQRAAARAAWQKRRIN